MSISVSCWNQIRAPVRCPLDNGSTCTCPNSHYSLLDKTVLTQQWKIRTRVCTYGYAQIDAQRKIKSKWRWEAQLVCLNIKNLYVTGISGAVKKGKRYIKIWITVICTLNMYIGLRNSNWRWLATVHCFTSAPNDIFTEPLHAVCKKQLSRQ
jgi:hypothetical protein